MTRATLYDGRAATPNSGRVEVRGWQIAFVSDAGERLAIEPALLTRGGEGSDQRLGHKELPGWRLRLDEEPSAELAALLPRPPRYGGFIDRIGLTRAAIALAGVTAAVLFVGYSAPAWLAPYVPQRWERDLGTAMVGDFGDNRCSSARVEAALVRLAERVSPGSTSGPDAIRIAALDIDMVNAAALPGGNVIFFDGILREARNAEALAGVMAHEIAHVRRRHVTEALIRELGIGALIQVFAGGIGANAGQIASLSFTRTHEGEADADAIAKLRAAGIDPRPTAALFRQMGAAEGRASIEIEWLASHPEITGRARRFEAAHRPGAVYRPALSPEDSRLLLAGCLGTRE